VDEEERLFAASTAYYLHPSDVRYALQGGLMHPSVDGHVSRSCPFPFQLAELFSFSWTFGFFLCKLVYYAQTVSATASVLNLTAMSMER